MVAQKVVTVYKSTDFSHLKGLAGISDNQVAAHLELYKGYVTNTNKLNEQLAELAAKNTKPAPPEFAEMKRRLGFEYNGMILHEYYFSNLTPNGKDQPADGSQVAAALDRSFGGFEAWQSEFVNVGTMRGVGWAILYQDPATGALSNHWVTLHEEGHPAGFKPILIMDVWEHAYVLDYKFSERAKYIDAFLGNIDWDTVEKRLVAPGSVRPAAA
jgi:superoxide dismutase, Fe-Mn family